MMQKHDDSEIRTRALSDQIGEPSPDSGALDRSAISPCYTSARQHTYAQTHLTSLSGQFCSYAPHLSATHSIHFGSSTYSLSRYKLWRRVINLRLRAKMPLSSLFRVLLMIRQLLIAQKLPESHSNCSYIWKDIFYLSWPIFSDFEVHRLRNRVHITFGRKWLIRRRRDSGLVYASRFPLANLRKHCCLHRKV